MCRSHWITHVITDVIWALPKHKKISDNIWQIGPSLSSSKDFKSLVVEHSIFFLYLHTKDEMGFFIC